MNERKKKMMKYAWDVTNRMNKMNRKKEGVGIVKKITK